MDGSASCKCLIVFEILLDAVYVSRGLPQDSDYSALSFLIPFLSTCLQELVPCVLLSFDDEQILMWRGPDWVSMSQEVPPPSEDSGVDIITSKERGMITTYNTYA